MQINFYTQNINFSLKNKSRIRKWITAVAEKENYSTGEINYIFCDDDYLLELNKKYLKHDTLTDIITLNYSEQTSGIKYKASADIFISIPRVRENAKKFNVPFSLPTGKGRGWAELYRVMIHGILHLCGYNDKTPKEKKIMRKKENDYLKLFWYKA